MFIEVLQKRIFFITKLWFPLTPPNIWKLSYLLSKYLNNALGNALLTLNRYFRLEALNELLYKEKIFWVKDAP